jgi:hypothetical protein
MTTGAIFLMPVAGPGPPVRALGYLTEWNRRKA